MMGGGLYTVPRYGVHRFLLAASGSFSRFATYGLSTSRPLSVCNRAVTRPINACVICNCVFLAGVEAGIKKRPSSSAYGKDEKRYVQSTHGFRGTTFIRCHLSIATSLGRGAIDKPVGLINSPTPHARSRGQPARSTLGEAGWFAATGLSIAPLSHDGDDWCSRATNGRPPISACGIQGLLRRMFAMGFPPVAHSLYATGPVTLPSKPVRYFFVV